jgi:hypothetical protein
LNTNRDGQTSYFSEKTRLQTELIVLAIAITDHHRTTENSYMNKPELPEMNCVPLPKFALDDWPKIHRLFEPLPSWKLQQAWLAAPKRDHLVGTFKAGSWSDALLVYAELHDIDIFNPVTKFNEVAFTEGDAFEMFLRPEGQATYFEFHVTPHNQKLQLRIPSAEWFASPPRKRSHDEFFNASRVAKQLFDSRTQVCADEHKWYVVAVIPFASVVEGDPSRATQWRFSASRYDYTRGHEKPVLSSTSPHRVCNFHRQQEWGTLHLVPFAAGVAQKQGEAAQASV